MRLLTIFQRSILLSVLLCGVSVAQQFSMMQSPAPPKREFRGAWIATVTNLDWPTSPTASPAVQQQQLISLLDSLKGCGVNAVIFQVRTECDALYASSIDPWSYWLTGSQGTAPNPWYDPLAFAVQEAHKRGMELHAWFNPYRAVRNVSGTYPISSQHVTVQHPSWIIQIGNIKFLDPGLPQVRTYVLSVVMDIVNRYDVDGIHADDYFYPYPPDQITTQDNATFAAYPRGFSNQGEWRRDNINLLIKAIHDSVQLVKPWVKFGMSPFGIWKNGVPSGITGLDAYNVIYCDAVAWLQNKWIDYLTPQLYWKITGSQDYSKLMPWWASQLNGQHLYPGHGAYRIVTSGWTSSELPNQVRLNRASRSSSVLGNVFYRAGNGVLDNLLGFADSLRTDLYRTVALSPVMPWKDSVLPNPVQNLRLERLAGTGPASLRWDPPSGATFNDSAAKYVVYRFDHGTVLPSEIDDPAGIVAVEPAASSIPRSVPTPPAYYVVTALDRGTNESAISSVLQVTPPTSPALAGPVDGTSDLVDTAALRWFNPSTASWYQVQVATDSTFGGGMVLDANVWDTTLVVRSLGGQVPYYWRVKGVNPGGYGPFSTTWAFMSALPAIPTLALPINAAVNQPLTVTLFWNVASAATSYRIQMSRAADFASQMVIDTTGIADTSLTVSGLTPSKLHFWRVLGRNTLGSSPWSAVSKFGTTTSIVAAGALPFGYELRQNYPNPFNPQTTIPFTLGERGPVTLKVYDLLGREIATLVQAEMAAGDHQVVFDAGNLPSGIYFYRLLAEGKADTRRMLLLK